jgi:molybdate transport system substrate-binding protein
MPDLVARHRAVTGTQVDVVYGASDKLAAGAAGGKGLDVLVLAEQSAFAGVNAEAPRVIATTTLVLVGPDRAPYRFENLRDEGVIAIGDPDAVPAGRYARRYLASLGIWESVEPRLVYGGDVAGVLALAQRGTAHVAVVYATDFEDAAPLVVLDRASGGPTVQISAATVRLAPHAAAADRFVQFLASADAQAILTRHAFAAAPEVVR